MCQCSHFCLRFLQRDLFKSHAAESALGVACGEVNVPVNGVHNVQQPRILPCWQILSFLSSYMHAQVLRHIEKLWFSRAQRLIGPTNEYILQSRAREMDCGKKHSVQFPFLVLDFTLSFCSGKPEFVSMNPPPIFFSLFSAFWLTLQISFLFLSSFLLKHVVQLALNSLRSSGWP